MRPLKSITWTFIITASWRHVYNGILLILSWTTVCTRWTQVEDAEPFTGAEWMEAFSSRPVKKSPGDGGFLLDFLKNIPLLMGVLEQSRGDGHFPDSFSQAVLTVIDKKVKTLKNVPPADQSTLCTSYENDWSKTRSVSPSAGEPWSNRFHDKWTVY